MIRKSIDLRAYNIYRKRILHFTFYLLNHFVIAAFLYYWKDKIKNSNSIQKHLCLFLLIEFHCMKLLLRIKLWYLIYNWCFHVLKVTYQKSREYPFNKQVTKKIAFYFFFLKLKLSIYLVVEISEILVQELNIVINNDLKLKFCYGKIKLKTERKLCECWYTVINNLWDIS